MAKEFVILRERCGRCDTQKHFIKGTLERFIKNCFGYTLDCGYSWNPKINTNPKIARGLIISLNKCVDALQGSCYTRDHYSLSSVEEYMVSKEKGENCYLTEV